ncbi:MAG: fused MFS/spermidine synthase [Candidatus Krumholzibacteriota bacterium]|nr:fused MFS/spermidine synthase [Candidatus Krumholzibacteriota bacterium]
MSQSHDNLRAPRAVQVVIFLAGFTFLIYEVAWYRQLALALGTTVTASTLVLASFMAGFGAGARVWGRVAHGHRPGRLLAGLLAGIGILGALSHLAIAQGMPRIYTALAAAGIAPGPSAALVFVLAAGLLAAPAFLMGGLFPLVSRIAVGPDDPIAPILGRLYAMETLGSALGGLAAGFLLLGTLGQRGTVAVAVAINLALAGWLFAPRRFAEAAAPPAAAASQEMADPAILARIALTGTAACGFAMLALQVIWLRIFRVYFTNTSYTFALVSSLVILGLFAGGALFARRGRDAGDHPRSLLRVLALMAGLAGLGLLLLLHLPRVLMFPFQAALASPLARVLLLPAVASLLVVVPPAVCSGYAFPLACRMAASRATLGRDVGLVLMVNTAGAVAGPLAAAFLLIPALGAARSALLVVALLAAAALVIQLQRRPRAGRPARVGLAAAAAALAALVAFGPELRILPPSFTRADREVLFYRESVEGTLAVGRDRGARARSLHTYVNNSAVIGASYDAVKVVKMVGHFPFFLGAGCRDVLVIGFGIGVTTSAIAAHPEVASIECVELVAGLKDAARFYRDLNHDVVADPRLSIIAGDGRHHLQRTPRRYDLISCDPTHPILGSANLYTREYFVLCRERLNPGGVVSQYLPLHKLRTEDLQGLIRTFHAVFPHCTVWLGHYHAVLLGSREPIRIDFGDWAAAVARTGPDEHFYAEPHHLAATLVLDGAAVAGWEGGSGINTDDRSYTEFFAPACLDEGNLAANLRFLAERRIDVGTVFTNIPDPALMDRFVAGNRLLTESLYHRLRGSDALGLRALRRACEANPEDQEYPFLIRLYY